MLRLVRQTGTAGAATHSKITILTDHYHIISRDSLIQSPPYNRLMKTHRSNTLEPSHIDNFSVRSKPADNAMVEPKEDRIRKREKTV